MLQSPRRCVYTVLTGGYEPLNEQPAARESSLPFFCFTDMPGTTSETWEIRRFAPYFTEDPIRSQRAGKLRPHALLPEFDQSLYIDNSVLLRQPPEQLFATADLTKGLCLPWHSFRANLLDEFTAVAQDCLDDPARIAEQLAHTMAGFPSLLGQVPFWSAILLRDHHHKLVQTAMEIWLAHIFRYSRRDQLSSLVAFHLAGLEPGVLEIDNFDSAFHSWPHISGRKTERRLWREDQTAALQQLLGEAEQLRRLTQLECRVTELEYERQQLADEHQQLECEHQQLEYEHQRFLSATTWRMLEPARAIMRWLRQVGVSSK